MCVCVRACAQVIVTVPLAVLKGNMVTFTPPLNSHKKAAIQNLGAGLVEKVSLEGGREDEGNNVLMLGGSQVSISVLACDGGQC